MYTFDMKKLFHMMHPDFFNREYIKSISDDKIIFDEMLLNLNDFDDSIYEKSFDNTVSFGFYCGNRNELLEKVRCVEDDWVDFFGETDIVFCGYVNGEVVSFCIVEDMGEYEIDGKRVKIGGPGCVGTLPEHRNNGIGLTMVKRATQILKNEGFDYSYIHYTHIADWYSKLGYKTVLQWTKNGVCNTNLK